VVPSAYTMAIGYRARTARPDQARFPDPQLLRSANRTSAAPAARRWLTGPLVDYPPGRARANSREDVRTAPASAPAATLANRAAVPCQPRPLDPDLYVIAPWRGEDLVDPDPYVVVRVRAAASGGRRAKCGHGSRVMVVHCGDISPDDLVRAGAPGWHGHCASFRQRCVHRPGDGADAQHTHAEGSQRCPGGARLSWTPTTEPPRTARR
jgi:hypothetical protein